jgi:AcrR family transcriptional regulator
MQGEQPQASGRRPRGSKAETQARILEAATSLFAARGYEHASITAIAERAKVSRAAIFWHFGDKETLFRESLRRLLEPFVARLAEPSEDADPAARAQWLLSVYDEFVDEQRTTIHAIVRWAFESPQLRESLREPLLALHDHFVRDVADTLARATGDPGSARALGAALVSMLDGNLLLGLLDPDADRRRLRQAGLRLLLEGVLRGAGPA